MVKTSCRHRSIDLFFFPSLVLFQFFFLSPCVFWSLHLLPKTEILCNAKKQPINTTFIENDWETEEIYTQAISSFGRFCLLWETINRLTCFWSHQASYQLPCDQCFVCAYLNGKKQWPLEVVNWERIIVVKKKEKNIRNKNLLNLCFVFAFLCHSFHTHTHKEKTSFPLKRIAKFEM